MKVLCQTCGEIHEKGDCKIQKERKNEYFKDYYKKNANNPAFKLLHTKEYRDLRKEILVRDNFMCQRCLIKFGIIQLSDLTAHHILSRKNYPKRKFVLNRKNLIICCQSCNNDLGNSDELDFQWSYPDGRIFPDGSEIDV